MVKKFLTKSCHLFCSTTSKISPCYNAKPMLAIELNGESHDVLKKKLQDEDVKRHFDEAGLPILVFHNHQSLTVQELKTSIDLKLK